MIPLAPIRVLSGNTAFAPTRRSPVGLTTAAGLAALLALATEATALAAWPAVFVGVEDVPASLLAPSGASITVLDARKRKLYRRGHIPGAQHAGWTRYRASWFKGGRLPDDLDELARDLAELGVDDDRPVLVCGDAEDGWGEEGRIAWMIRYLGHRAVAILDGGCDAWLAAGRPFSEEETEPPAGTFTPRIQPALRALTPDVLTALGDDSIQLLDVRSAKEFNGASPYFEARRGHIPTAINVPFRAFFDTEGRVQNEQAIEAALKHADIDRDRRLIVYCTAGVRSAFVTERLREFGIEAANYEASFWGWSSDPGRPVAAGKK